jgi:prepilin-type processing-associated H-X9-DG protein
MKLTAALALTAISASLVLAQHNSQADQDKATNAAKLIALGTLMYTQDFDDKFPSSAKQSASTYPYVRHYDAIFLPFPRDKPAVTFNFAEKGSRPVTIKTAFVFNTALYGKLTTKVKAPDKTVLWSYGPREHLSYAFQGKALIAFADGHVKLVTKEEVKKLRWNP